MKRNKIKWNISTNDLTTIAICISIAVILGKALGVLHKIMPFSRGIINAPFYSFIVALILYRTKKYGSITLFALGYGLTMARISIFSTLSIIIGGILSDIIIFAIARKYNSNIKIALCAPIYSASGILGTFITVTFLIESSLYMFEGVLALLISMLTVYGAGLIGSLFAMKIFEKRLLYNDRQIRSGI